MVFGTRLTYSFLSKIYSLYTYNCSVSLFNHSETNSDSDKERIKNKTEIPFNLQEDESDKFGSS